jgi:hypothetical protein
MSVAGSMHAASTFYHYRDASAAKSMMLSCESFRDYCDFEIDECW